MNMTNDKPFSLDKGKNMMKQYSEYWQRFICYCIRTLNDENNMHKIQFTPEQRELLMELRELAENNDRNENVMNSLIIIVSAQLIMHSDYEQRTSILMHFCRVIDYNAMIRAWRVLGNYTSMLAGMQFCIRLIMLERTLSQD